MAPVTGNPRLANVPGSAVERGRNFFTGMTSLRIPPVDETGESTESDVIAENEEVWTRLLSLYQQNDMTGLSYLIEAIWDKISIFFLPMWDGVANSFAIYSQLAVERAFGVFKRFVEQEGFIPKLARNLGELKNAKTTEDVFRELDEFSEEHPILSFPFLSALTVGNFISFLLAALSAKREKLSQEANREERPAIPGLGDMIEMMWKANLPPTEQIEILEKLGFPGKYHAPLIQGSENQLTPDNVAELLNRGEISDTEANEHLRKNRLGGDNIGKLKKLFKPIPPVQDMVRFAVREAFSPRIVQKFGLDDDFPQEFAANAAKLGLTEQWARAYWRAHWELPSLTMGFQMFHREIISREELLTLMQTQDVMPFWRDKLMALSHNPYTRVDVRRMHKEGVLSEEDVFKAYLDLGYNSERAEKLTEFVLKLNAKENKEASKSDILSAFKKGVILETEAKQMLKDIGYGINASELLILRENFDVEKKRRDAATRWIRKVYVAGRMDQSEAMIRLSEVDIVGGQANSLIADWDMEKKELHIDVTFAQLVDMLRYKIIDRVTFTNELAMRGFDNVEVDRLTELALIKVKGEV